MYANCGMSYVDVSEDPSKEYDLADAVIKFSTAKEIKDKVDTFQVELSQQNLPKGIELDAEDTVKLYLGSVNSPTDLAFDGLVKNLTFNETDKDKTYSLKGQSRVEALLSNQIPMNEINETANKIGSKMVARANEYNSENPNWEPLVWNGNDALTQTNIFQKQPRPIFEHMDEISTDEFTGDGQYIYYLDDDGTTFVWKSIPTTTTDTIEAGVNDVLSTKAQKTEYDVVNFAIIDGGTDFNGAPIKKEVFNNLSIGKIGYKQKYFTDNNIAKQAKFRSGCAPSEDHPFGDPANWTGGNANFRGFVIERIKDKWQPIVNYLGLPRWKVKLTMRGTLGYNRGDLYDVDVKAYEGKKNLQLKKVSQDFNKNEWKTQLDFEQTEEAAVEEWA